MKRLDEIKQTYDYDGSTVGDISYLIAVADAAREVRQLHHGKPGKIPAPGLLLDELLDESTVRDFHCVMKMDNREYIDKLERFIRLNVSCTADEAIEWIDALDKERSNGTRK